MAGMEGVRRRKQRQLYLNNSLKISLSIKLFQKTIFLNFWAWTVKLVDMDVGEKFFTGGDGWGGGKWWGETRDKCT